MESTASPGSIGRRDVPEILLALGIGFCLVITGETVLYAATGLRDVTEASFVVGALATLPFALALCYVGYWLRRSDLSHRRYARVALWTTACGAGFLLLNVALIVSQSADSPLVAFSWLRWAAALGTGVGAGVGVVEARAIQQAIVTERVRMQSEHVERQRDTLDYLNSVLRHEILNTTTKIDGYASRVLAEEPDLDPESERWLRIVVEEAEDMSSVIDDVRVLMRRTTGDQHLEPVDLEAILAAELRDLEHTRESVTVEAAIPEGVEVRADDTLRRVFGNLFANAVEHHDGPDPTVSVDVEVTGDAVRVVVSDDGPGIPEEELERLWDRDSTMDDSHGLGLYLVNELVESYGGEIELTETGQSGTTFTVELPPAAADDPPRAEPATA